MRTRHASGALSAQSLITGSAAVRARLATQETAHVMDVNNRHVAATASRAIPVYHARTPHAASGAVRVRMASQETVSPARISMR